ncbi:AP2 domain family protein [Babesia bovis T2Bo]|uniref:Uncharacterized protein n=1 Tax=Babesia bovis TaxID=5865 RepID=A7ATL7_BABBO|nr:AP2 domain family protein [Babesia bovis T2Bo]EDO06278.1 AP2 domain family protein [Babesia bovis T2Bo]|eukprot:XP_001609846.1 hypothetical protein [Babesia bovis T2Bo]
MDEDKGNIPPVPTHQAGLPPAEDNYAYDNAFMCQMPPDMSRGSPDMPMNMPPFVQNNANMGKMDEQAFEGMPMHPTMHMQMPPNEHMPNAIAMGMPVDETQAHAHMMGQDDEMSSSPNGHHAMPPLAYPGAPPFNRQFSPNMMNFQMVPPPRMGEMPVPPMFRFAPPKDGVNNVFPPMDGDGAHNAMAHLTKSVGMIPPRKTPNILYNAYNLTVERYQNLLRIRAEAAKNGMDYNGGIIFDKGPFSQGGRWLVFWICNGRMWRKSFLVHMYGADGAKELAEQFWFSKMRAMQLYRITKTASMKLDKDLKKFAESQKITRPRRPPSRSTPSPTENTAEVKKPVVLNDLDIFWEEESSSWCFDYLDPDTNTMTIKRVHVTDPSTSHEKKMEASKLRSEHWQDLIKVYTESEYSGHTYEKSRTCWRVSHWIPSKGINRNRYFNITKYGYIEAKEKSRLYRLLVHDLGGEEPESFPVDSKTPPEFFEDPVTKFYHRILNSLRNK